MIATRRAIGSRISPGVGRCVTTSKGQKTGGICMSVILGISAFYHDSAAALVLDGRIVAAAQEERFTRIKHDSAFPTHAINYCLKAGGVSADDLDYVGFYDKPLTKFERLLETYLAYAPSGFRSFRLAMPLWLKDKLHMRRTLTQWPRTTQAVLA